MKRLVSTGLLFALAIFMGIVAWFYAIVPEVEGNTNFKLSGDGYFYVTVPLGGRTYINVPIDNMNTELQETNQLTMWKYNDSRIVRTSYHEPGKPYKGDIMYNTNKEVYKQIDSYYVSVHSDESWLGYTAEEFQNCQPYEAPVPDLEKETQIESLPNVELPTDYDPDAKWKLPMDVEELVLSQSSEDMSYYKNGWYFNYNFRYQKWGDAIADAAARVCALSGQGLDWYYTGDGVFIAKSGNEIACVRQETYTSCYFISSNDLAYILLNLE